MALDILVRVDEAGSYSNLLLHQTLQKHQPDKADAGLVTELVYGTIQRRSTLDYYLDRLVTKGASRLQPWVRSLLRLSLYQLLFLDRVPDHAAVHEAVEIAKRRGHAGISGMVNGVLRGALRGKDELRIPDTLAPAARIALQHAHPEWLVTDWIRRFGVEEAERICAANNEPPRASLRVNPLRQTRAALIGQLREAGYSAVESELTEAGIVVESGGNLALTAWYEAGDYSIQDESSMLVAEMLEPSPGMNVLDCCAAPGGKATHIAERMDDKGHVLACDLHEHKRALIEAQAARLGLASVETMTADARELPERLSGRTFERILLDAPCTGLGVIRRKPDIKWTKRPEDSQEIARLQAELLAKAASLLAPGGILVYSTCTLSETENEQVVDNFLRVSPEFEPAPLPERLMKRLPPQLIGEEGRVTVLPHQFGSDGFFIARLRRRP